MSLQSKQGKESTHRKAKRRRKEDGVYSGKHCLNQCAVRRKRREIEAATKDNVSPPYPLPFSWSVHALNNLKLYSTAGDKVNRTAEALAETEGDGGRNITARYLTRCDKRNSQCSGLHKEDNFLDYCSRLSCNVTWLHLSSTLSFGKTDSSACLSSAIYHCTKINPLYFSVCEVDKECHQGYDAGRAWSKKDCVVCGCMLTLQEHASAMEGLSGIGEEECSTLEWSSKPAFVCSNQVSPHTTLKFMYEDSQEDCMLQNVNEIATIVRVLKILLCLALMMTTVWLSPPSWWCLDKLDFHHYAFKTNRSPQHAISTALHSIFTHSKKKNSYISMPLVDCTQHSTQSHPWVWLENLTLQAWIKHSATGYQTSSEAEPQRKQIVR